MVLLSNRWGVLVCQEEGITQSMSRKATCLDTAVAENFEKTIADCIDRRIQLKRNGLNSVQYRIQTVQVT
jgi:transposase InsO family protein